MKKFNRIKILTFTAILALLLMMLCGCGKQQAATGAITQLIEKGYTHSQSTYENGTFAIEYVSADRTDFVLVKCKMSEEKCNDFFAIDSSEEDYEKQCATFIENAGRVTTESLNDKIPPQSTWDEFIGKPLSELQNAGYEQTGLGDDEKVGAIYFEYGNETYRLKVLTREKYEALFDMGDIDLNDLIVESISFYDFANIEF